MSLRPDEREEALAPDLRSGDSAAMRVLGLDPGSRRTGYGLVARQGGRIECVVHGTIRTSECASLAERLATIATAVAGLLDEHAPDAVVVEEAFYHRNVRSTLVLGHVRGALLVTAAQRGIAVAEYSPRTIKLGVTGWGAAPKEQVAAMVQRLLGLARRPEADAADALAGALCHLSRPAAARAVDRARRAPGRGGAALVAAQAAREPRRRTPSADRLAALLATAAPRVTRRAGGAR